MTSLFRDSAVRRPIPVRLGEHEIALIDAAAEGLQLPRSTFMRPAAVQVAAQALADDHNEVLPARKAIDR
jgi:uncharacterized protein (DUF1778 family)